jgi:hypothetical protein
MLIATFGPTTAWVGKQITHEGDAFVLEDHGPISAGDIMEYDRQGHLVWVDYGTRAWVGSRAKQPKAPKTKRAKASSAAAPTATATTTTTPSTVEPRAATRDTGSQPLSRKKTYLKRALLLAIAVLIVANVVLVLILAGVFPRP